MIALVLVVALFVLFGLLTFAAWNVRTTEANLHERQRRAELTIDREVKSAKRAMNDAAGQSWRNLAG